MRNRNEQMDERVRQLVEMTMKITEPKTYEMMMTKRKEGERELGIEIDGEWRPIDGLRTKEIYVILMNKRLKLNNYTPKRAHASIKSINKKLTPKERDFWWRHTHELISIRKNEHKWRKNDDGSMMTNICAMCMKEIETRQHYEYGCETNEKWRKHVMKYVNEMNGEEGMNDMMIEKWNLNEKDMDETTMIIIAKARWIYQKERGKIMNRNRMMVDMNVMMNTLKRAMARVGM
jgi:hypothetical protein